MSYCDSNFASLLPHQCSTLQHTNLKKLYIHYHPMELYLCSELRLYFTKANKRSVSIETDAYCSLSLSLCLSFFSDILCSPCWRCCLRNVSRPHKDLNASHQPALMWTLKILYTSRNENTSPSSVKIQSWTTW